MRLTYIIHSCFVLQSSHFSIIFDYYKDSQHNFIEKHINTLQGEIYVLSSHAHNDHFTNEIFNWTKKRKDIKYILSTDILEDKLCKQNDAIFLDKQQEYSDKNLSIKAFGSTDKGISFLIHTAQGKTIFHAGDLNNWHWNEESTPEEIAEAEAYYQSELDLLVGQCKKMDLCMFPVDYRLGKEYTKGAIQLLKSIQVNTFVPMHFWENYQSVQEAQEQIQPYTTHYWNIKHQDQSLYIP